MRLVSEWMTRGVRALSPRDTAQQAAQAMDELNLGAMPVCDGDRLIGLVTERDIAVRVVARGLPPGSTQVGLLMTVDLHWCHEDQSIDEVLDQPGPRTVRRLPVVDQAGRLVGMLALGDLAAAAARALRERDAQALPRSGEP